MHKCTISYCSPQNYTEENGYFDIPDENEDDENKNNFYHDGNLNFDLLDNESDIIIRPCIHQLLSETRRIIIFFRKSALRNGILQKHVQLKENKCLSFWTAKRDGIHWSQ